MGESAEDSLTSCNRRVYKSLWVEFSDRSSSNWSTCIGMAIAWRSDGECINFAEGRARSFGGEVGHGGWRFGETRRDC